MSNLIELFDDFTKDKHGVWSQICKKCACQLNISESMLDEAGSGICGVKGCKNEADFYIDFE